MVEVQNPPIKKKKAVKILTRLLFTNRTVLGSRKRLGCSETGDRSLWANEALPGSALPSVW